MTTLKDFHKRHTVQVEKNEMLTDSVTKWIYNFLDIPCETLNNLPPCPFAKQALLANKIKIHEIKPNINISMQDLFVIEMENYTYHWPKGKEVVILGCDPKLITALELEDSVDIATEKFIANRGYIALEDHPNHIEQVKDLVFNQGEYALILLQEAEKLNKARKILKRQGYYINWPDDYYEDVVNR